MSKIRIKLKPTNGVKVKTDTTYLFDPTLALAMIALSRDWAVKQDGQVEEEGQDPDYSSKAWAIGGSGTETNNAKYYAEQAADSATNAYNASVTASTKANEASASAGTAISKAGEAATSASNALTYSQNAATSETNAGVSATNAHTSEVNAASSASTASSQATIATNKAGEASGYATAAQGSASTASGAADEARAWATGDDDEVGAYEEGEHSSHTYANIAMAIANADEDEPIIDGLEAVNVIRGPKGDKGDKGDPGSDASVTITNIVNALGYLPVNPANLGAGIITIRQGGVTKGTFSVNQANDKLIDLDAGGGGGSYDIDGGRADTIYVVGQIIDGGRADTIYTSAQTMDGGNA